jgi:hypothetical protein
MAFGSKTNPRPLKIPKPHPRSALEGRGQGGWRRPDPCEQHSTMGHAVLLALACAFASLGHSAATGVAPHGGPRPPSTLTRGPHALRHRWRLSALNCAAPSAVWCACAAPRCVHLTPHSPHPPGPSSPTEPTQEPGSRNCMPACLERGAAARAAGADSRQPFRCVAMAGSDGWRVAGVWGGSDGAARRDSAVSTGPVGGTVAGAMRLRGGGAVQLFEIKVCSL